MKPTEVKNKSIGEIQITHDLLLSLLGLHPARYGILEVYQKPGDYNYFRIIVEDYNKELYDVPEGGAVPSVTIECEKISAKVVK